MAATAGSAELQLGLRAQARYRGHGPLLHMNRLSKTPVAYFSKYV